MSVITLSANTSWYLYNFRAGTLRALTAAGHDVVCLAPEDDYSARLADELDCRWLPLAMDNQGANPIADAGLVMRLWRHYRQLRPAAALHFTVKNNVYGTWAARSLGIPVINTVSGLGTAFIRPGPVGWVVRGLYRSSQPFAGRVFCQNEEDYRLLVEGRLVPGGKLELVPGSGVDLRRFSPVQGDQANGGFRFLYAGRMLADKGLLELVEAVGQLNTAGQACSLWLCGFPDTGNVSAITSAQLQQWAEQPWIQWLGPSDDMPDIYRQVSCVVLPSYREGLPRSLLEAGAMGLPVIASDVPGCRQLVRDGENGLLCQARDVESLRDALQRMLSLDSAARATMGAAGRAQVEARYDERLVVEMTLRAVREVLAG